MKSQLFFVLFSINLIAGSSAVLARRPVQIAQDIACAISNTWNSFTKPVQRELVREDQVEDPFLRSWLGQSLSKEKALKKLEELEMLMERDGRLSRREIALLEYLRYYFSSHSSGAYPAESIKAAGVSLPGGILQAPSRTAQESAEPAEQAQAGSSGQPVQGPVFKVLHKVLKNLSNEEFESLLNVFDPGSYRPQHQMTPQENQIHRMQAFVIFDVCEQVLSEILNKNFQMNETYCTEGVSASSAWVALMYVNRFLVRNQNFQLTEQGLNQLFSVALLTAAKIQEFSYPDSKKFIWLSQNIEDLEKKFYEGIGFDFRVDLRETEELLKKIRQEESPMEYVSDKKTELRNFNGTEYSKGKRLGLGTFSNVCIAQDSKSEKYYAVKSITAQRDPRSIDGSFAVEIMVLLNGHPSIVSLQGVSLNSLYPTLFLEYCSQGTLKDIFRHRELTDQEIKKWMRQLLEGLEHLHKFGFMHRDIKPENLLVNEAGDLKIADFGSAREIFNVVEQKPHPVVTRWYRAPELLMLGTRYGPEIDVWSAGCIFAEMVLRKSLFHGEDDSKTLLMIFCLLGVPTLKNFPLHRETYMFYKYLADLENMSATVPRSEMTKSFQTTCQTILNKLGQDGYNLLMRLLVLEPSRRITAALALQDPYFQGP